MQVLSRNVVTSLVLAGLLAGCQPGALGALVGTQFGQLVFNKAGDQARQLVSETAQTTGSTGSGAMTAAPAIAPVAPGIMAPTRYGMGDYELVDTTEAKAAGFQGTFNEALAKVVQPVLQSWANDALLRSASGMADAQGANLKSDSGDAVYKGDGWRFSYFSPTRRESLDFVINAAQTLIVKQTWKPRQIDLSGVKLGSTDVIALVTKAIQDKNAVVSDPQSGGGTIYYMGGGSGTAGSGVATPGAVAVAAVAPMPAIAPAANVSTSVASGPVTSPPLVKPDNGEELFTVPDGARWNLSLTQEPNRLVWSAAMWVDPATTPDISGAYARVDAGTGALLSLSRPRRFHIPQPIVEPKPPEPAPQPSATAKS